jgi:hypothetical protein
VRRRVLAAALTLVAGCASTGATRAPVASDATELYLARLLAGDTASLRAGFAGEPSVDDPLFGPIRGEGAFAPYVAARASWLRSRAARLTQGRITRGEHRTIVEATIELTEASGRIALPVAVVGDHQSDGRVSAIRVYHSVWPLEGKHRVRPPLLARDPNAHVTGVVAEYQRALAAGDLEAILATFEPDGYFREPSGGEYVHRGPTQLRKFMTEILSAGGIGLEHATVTDDGVVTAIEFNAISFGSRPLTPQAGLAIYERGPTGHIAAARIYDDVNVEQLAPGGALQ